MEIRINPDKRPTSFPGSFSQGEGPGNEVGQTSGFIRMAISPVPELSFLPASYRGWTRAGERRVQDNLHAHAQNAAIFSPKIGGKKPYLEVFSRFGLWRDFLNDNTQATISAFRLIENLSIKLAKPHSICFLSQYQRERKKSLPRFVDNWKHDSDLKVHALFTAVKRLGTRVNTRVI